MELLNYLDKLSKISSEKEIVDAVGCALAEATREVLCQTTPEDIMALLQKGTMSRIEDKIYAALWRMWDEMCLGGWEKGEVSLLVKCTSHCFSEHLAATEFLIRELPAPKHLKSDA